ncbi:ATP-binding protein [Agromyces soli]
MTDASSGRPLVDAAALSLVREAIRVRRPRAIAIDGPSGAGKSTLADEIGASWRARPEIVRLDEVYRGWRGLDAGARELARSVVPSFVGRRPGRLHGWDWAASSVLAEPRTLRPGRPLVIEGCGAFAAVRRRPGVLRIWIDSSLERRRTRALARDEGRFDPYWELWEEEWRRYLGRSGGAAAVVARADLVIAR